MESIKCHHNDIANYIKSNYIQYKNGMNENLSDNVKLIIVCSYNFSFFILNKNILKVFK